MSASLSPSVTHASGNVTVNYGGILIPCASFTFARDVEDSFVQTADVSNMDGTATLEIPLQQKSAIDLLLQWMISSSTH